MALVKIQTWAAAAALSVIGVFALSSAAHAITCSPVAGKDRYMSFDGGTACLASGTYSGGNKSEDQFEALYPAYSYLGKEEDSAPNGLDGRVDAVGGSSLFAGTTGKIDWTPPSGFSAFAVLFKFGRGNISDAWFSFELPTSSFKDSSWSLLDGNGDAYTQHELSHTTLYGIKGGGDNNTPDPVPLPAAGFLLIGALGGLGLMRRRKKS